MIRVLLVEDDKSIAMGLSYSLNQEGYQLENCYNVASAKTLLSQNEYDLLILDLSLPDGSGYDICRMVKDGNKETPVIFLTACDDEVNVVMGLDMGADDYITKPFRIRELISRMKSVLRRYQKGENQKNSFDLADIHIDAAKGRVFKNEQEIFLSPLEYRLLLTFANHPGRVLSRGQLLEAIWDIGGEYVNDNTLTVYIKRLRQKIGDNVQEPEIIKTVRGMGYKVGD